MVESPTERFFLLPLIAYLLSHCLTEFVSDAQLLPPNEVKTLQIISNTLNNSLWTNISQNSCTEGRSFNRTFPALEKTFSNVTCNCSFQKGNICHVISIQLKGLNLSGHLPAEFGNLPQLRVLDLSRNYLNGKIPKSLSKIPITILSFTGNNISGSIPYEIGQISTLEEMTLDDNQLEGQLPETLGNLKNLKRLALSGNFFNGTIPETFSKLKSLTELRISGNNLSGKIPEFIGNFTNLNMLEIQGTSLQGPIPPSLSLLTNLTDLVISDLNTTSMDFPNLSSLSKLQKLVLRNCNITGRIPKYMENFSSLKLLDLSYNQLTGPVPNSMEVLHSLKSFKYLFLTNNSLSGTIPSWINGESRKYYDLSYNNFTGSSSYTCQQQPFVNLVSSFSTTGNNKVDWCLMKNLPCSNKHKYHSLFINCGGGKMNYEGNEYDVDSSPGGSSYFYASDQKWAYSSTGYFLNNEKAAFQFEDTSIPNVNSIYQSARLAPLSLKYYGLCLRQGSYNVKLHFAEIMFVQGHGFGHNARRIFDVAIQGNTVLKDFNIDAEPGGPEIIKEFNNVYVDRSGTLEIHLYWAGKGTTSIPKKGTYGPLISAITVTPNFRVGLSTGAIIGIVLASCVILLLVFMILRMRGYLGGKHRGNQEFQGLNTGYFTLKHIKAATNDFNLRNKIGEGGFGPVYKGVLSDGRVIAVKQLSSKSRQGNREFVNEIGMISALHHPNLVKLYGCCIEGKELLLVYEYMENNSLAHALFGEEDIKLLLNWQTRKRICLGIARGLAYLHEGSRLKIVHRDIKATNVLLDKDLNAKISDFGLARLDEEENTYINTRIAGTIGYMAPEYAMRGYLTDKADVYSFGVVVLEIVSGKSNAKYKPEEEIAYLLDWAYVLQEEGNILELVDPSLDSNYSQEEALMLLNLALLCTNPSPTLRPTMSSVVSMIDGQLLITPSIDKCSGINNELRSKALKTSLEDNESHVPGISQSSQVESSISMDCPWIDSSISKESKDDAKQISATSRLLVDTNVKFE